MTTSLSGHCKRSLDYDVLRAKRLLSGRIGDAGRRSPFGSVVSQSVAVFPAGRLMRLASSSRTACQMQFSTGGRSVIQRRRRVSSRAARRDPRRQRGELTDWVGDLPRRRASSGDGRAPQYESANLLRSFDGRMCRMAANHQESRSRAAQACSTRSTRATARARTRNELCAAYTAVPVRGGDAHRSTPCPRCGREASVHGLSRQPDFAWRPAVGKDYRVRLATSGDQPLVSLRVSRTWEVACSVADGRCRGCRHRISQKTCQALLAEIGPFVER